MKMKKRLFHSLLPLIFIVCGIVVNTDNALAFGGETVIVILDKTGQTYHAFSLPDKYLKAEGNLGIPMEVILLGKNGEVLYKAQTYTTKVELSDLDLPVGIYFLSLKIDELSYQVAINL